MKASKALHRHLAPIPADIRRNMLADCDNLAPGAAAVAGRFFTAIADLREPLDAPGTAPFKAAAKTESTLAALLRTLSKYAPNVSTAAGRTLRQGYYKTRYRKTPGTGAARKKPPADPTADWPAAWRVLYPALQNAPIKDVSRKQYVTSISRCAQVVQSGRAGTDLTFYEAWRLSEAFTAKGVKPITIAVYLGALVSLGRYGGVSDADLNGIRAMRDHLHDIAKGGDKLKYARIGKIMELGGFEFIVEQVRQMQEALHVLPEHTAEAEKLRQKIALCLLHMNKPGRTSDVSRWIIGKELVRFADGRWALEWVQEKSNYFCDAGRLWPEVCAALDQLILAGQPDRFIHLRYQQLQGCNWLTLSHQFYAGKWPSQQIKAAIGIPSHDLRTLAADYLRRTDPKNAADIIATHLGHKTLAAGDAYRAQAESEAATLEWAVIRKKIAASNKGLAP